MQKDSAINLAYGVGFWSSLITTVGGIVYFLVLLAMILAGQFTFPPSDAIQLFGGVISLLFCPVIVVMMSSLHSVTTPERKVFSQASLGLTLLFAMAVSINRFTQLGVVRQSLASGNVNGLNWFLPYEGQSVMFGLEMLGWGWFLGLAMLLAAPLFSEGRLHHWLRGLMIAYGVLGLTSAVAYLIGSPLASIGFIAWGVILFLITGLLTVYFRQN
jgi:hypothetical protein